MRRLYLTYIGYPDYPNEPVGSWLIYGFRIDTPKTKGYSWGYEKIKESLAEFMKQQNSEKGEIKGQFHWTEFGSHKWKSLYVGGYLGAACAPSSITDGYGGYTDRVVPVSVDVSDKFEARLKKLALALGEFWGNKASCADYYLIHT